MERTKFYSKDELSRELGISEKTLGNRIKEHDDTTLRALYKERRLFSHSEREYILDKIHHHQIHNPDQRGRG